MGGPASTTIDMAPAIGYLGDRNIVYAISCVGHGVSLTHLNGKTLTDLLLGKKSELTEVFFVNRRTLPWPPNPLRFIMAQVVRGILRVGDYLYD